jgi:hypothetical protein
VRPTVYQYDAKENEHKKDQFNHGGDDCICRVELSRLKRAGIVDGIGLGIHLPSGNQKTIVARSYAHIATTESVSLCVRMKS